MSLQVQNVEPLFTKRLGKDDDVEKHKATLAAWIQKCNDTLIPANGKNYYDPPQDKEDPLDQYYANIMQIRDIADAILCNRIADLDTFEGENFYVAYDKDANVQGWMIVEEDKDTREIYRLITSPDNIALQAQEKKHRGVGKKLIKHITDDMIQTGDKRYITVNAVDRAVGFYKKCGFEDNEKGKYENDLYAANDKLQNVSQLCSSALK